MRFSRACGGSLTMEESATMHLSLATIADTGEGPDLGVESDRWHPDDSPDTRPPVITFAGRIPLRRRNISVISGKAKTGKTSLREAMCAACFGSGDDMLGWDAGTSTGAVIVVDYEQCGDDFIWSCRRVWERAGRKPETRFRAYRLRDYNLEERRARTIEAIERAQAEVGTIDLIVLDGGSDWVASVNDPEESMEVVGEWLSLSTRQDCHICVVTHSNEGNFAGEDARGHLGKECQRKAEVVLMAKKNKSEDTEVFTPQHRKSGIARKSPFLFRWCKKAHMHVTVKAGQSKEDAETKTLAKILRVIARGDRELAITYSALVEAIMTAEDVSKASAKRRIRTMKEKSLLLKNPGSSKLILGDSVYRER